MPRITRLAHVVLMTGFLLTVKTRQDYLQPPLPQDKPYPSLLHEYDVIRLVDAYNMPIIIGGGTYANVTLAELRAVGGPAKFVAIKTFLQSSFDTIMKEVRIHRYIQHLNITPRLIGLLPSGPLTANISLVYEFLPFSHTLSHWVRAQPSLTVNQWLNVCIQMTEMLRKLHSFNVIFNDLHGQNVMIQVFAENDIYVQMIDFGFSTYQYGKPYYTGYGTLDHYSYLAPEVKAHTVTSKATDIYSMGNLFHQIALVTNNEKLLKLSQQCRRQHPQHRPSLHRVKAELKSLAFERWLQSCINTNRIDDDTIVNNTISCTDYFQFKSLTRQEEVKTIDRDIHNDVKFHKENTTSARKEKAIRQWTREFSVGFSLDCPVDLVVLGREDITEDIQLIDASQQWTFSLSRLKSDSQLIILKEFTNSVFEDIREEACNAALLSQIGVGPRFVGILFGQRTISTFTIVQEYFGSGITLYDFVFSTLSAEWNSDDLHKAATDDTIRPRGDIDRVCSVSRRELFEEIVRELFTRRGECERRSLRQGILENVCKKLTSYLVRIHGQGYVINNLKANNILVKSDRATKTFDTKIVDMGGMTGSRGQALRHGFDYLASFTYLAPEVKIGHRSSFPSDIYSLCYLIYLVLAEYLSTNHRRFVIHRYKEELSNQTHCYKRWRVESVSDFPQSSNECDRCKISFCNDQKKESRLYDIDNDIMCSYMSLHELLYSCMRGPAVCRPSLYTILNLLTRIKSQH